METGWRDLEGVKPRWNNQIHLLDEVLANMKNFSQSCDSEGISYVIWITL